MKKFTHKEASKAATEFQERYGLQTRVSDSEFPEDLMLENYSFFGIWIHERCICCIDNIAELESLREIARIIVATDEQLVQIKEWEKREAQRH